MSLLTSAATSWNDSGTDPGTPGKSEFLELTGRGHSRRIQIMNTSSNSLTSRREFIKTTGRVAAASALAGVVLPQVHAAPGGAIQLALIGCGATAPATPAHPSKLGQIRRAHL